MRGGLALVSYSAVTAALVAVSLGMAFEKLRTNEGAYHSEGNQLFLFVVTHLSTKQPKIHQTPTFPNNLAKCKFKKSLSLRNNDHVHMVENMHATIYNF